MSLIINNNSDENTVPVAEINVEMKKRLTSILGVANNTARMLLLLEYMEKLYLPVEFCIKEITNEIMKVLTVNDMKNLLQRYSAWIREHHITYAAVLNGREDMLVYYDMFVDKHTLVMPAIKSGNKEIFKRVFNDTMEAVDRAVSQGELKRSNMSKFDIKKNIWIWLDSIMALGNHKALEIILPRVKSIIAGANEYRITKFLVRAPKSTLADLVRVLTANDININTPINYYLNAACIHGIQEVINQYAGDRLLYVAPVYIGKSADKTLLDNYLSLFNVDVGIITMPNGEVINVCSHLLSGAFQSNKGEQTVEFITYIFNRFGLSPDEITFVIDKNITNIDMLKFIKLGVNVRIEYNLIDRDERFAYLVDSGEITTEKIHSILTQSGEGVIGNAFIKSMLARDHQMLVYILSNINDNGLIVEISTDTLLEILKKCQKAKPIIVILNELNRLVITDNLWGNRKAGNLYTCLDSYRMTAIINHSFEKYILGMIDLWLNHDIVVDSDGIVSAALCCDFEYFKDHKNAVLTAVKRLIIDRTNVGALKFNCGFLTRGYRYQSYLHNAHPEMVKLVLDGPWRQNLNFDFALKLALENPKTFDLVFDSFPVSWYKSMFIISGCLLRTQTFESILSKIIHANMVLDKPALQRAITLFASHGKDATIKSLIKYKCDIKVQPIDVALLSLRDRSDNLLFITRSLQDKTNNGYLSLSYLIAAFRRKTETIIKLSNSGIKYEKLDVSLLRGLMVNTDTYLESYLDDKLTDFNKLIMDLGQKNKLFENLHECVVSTLKYSVIKSKVSKQI